MIKDEIKDNSGEVRLFSPGLERAALLLPIPLTLFFGLAAFLPDMHFAQSQREWNLVADVVFFDATHTILTWTILCLPEGRAWLQNRQTRAPFFLPWWIGVALFFIALFCVDRLWLAKENPLIHDWLRLSLIFFPIWHTLAQSKGLSLSYNQVWQKAKAPIGDDRARLERARTWEHRAFALLITYVFLWRVPKVFGERILSAAMVHTLSWLVLGAAILSLAAVFRDLDRSLARKKGLFLSRLLIVPIWAHNPVGSIIYQGIHGMEYLFTFLHMSKGSSAPPLTKKRIYLLAVALFLPTFLFSLILGFHTQITAWLPGFSVFVVPIAALVFANTYTHFFFDRVLFRMRDADTREKIGGLLVTRSEP